MSNANLRIFPQLGAYPYEIGSSNSVGGINNSAMWPRNIPLSYFFNYGKKSYKKRKLRSKFSSKKRKMRRSKK